MPYKNIIKEFAEDTYYHVYARGVNKMVIFREDNDYVFFMYLLKKYLIKDFSEKKILHGVEYYVPVDSVFGQVELACFCLMNNHFHLIVYNLSKGGITALMRRALSSYSKYFNDKYLRQGPLIQGGYRAVKIQNEKQLITSGIYTHINPIKDKITSKLENYEYTSFNYYFYNKKARWLTINKLIKEGTDYKNMKRYLKDVDVEALSDIVL